MIGIATSDLIPPLAGGGGSRARPRRGRGSRPASRRCDPARHALAVRDRPRVLELAVEARASHDGQERPFVVEQQDRARVRLEETVICVSSSSSTSPGRRDGSAASVTSRASRASRRPAPHPRARCARSAAAARAPGLGLHPLEKQAELTPIADSVGASCGWGGRSSRPRTRPPPGSTSPATSSGGGRPDAAQEARGGHARPRCGTSPWVTCSTRCCGQITQLKQLGHERDPAARRRTEVPDRPCGARLQPRAPGRAFRSRSAREWRARSRERESLS